MKSEHLWKRNKGVSLTMMAHRKARICAILMSVVAPFSVFAQASDDLIDFQVVFSASNGDLMEGARAIYVDASGKSKEIALVDGQLNGAAPSGEVKITLIWKAQTVDIATLSLPAQRSEVVEVPITSVKATLVQKETGTPFGPSLIAAATPGNSFSAGQWSNNQGAVVLQVIEGDIQLQAKWFGAQVVVDGHAPGDVQILMPIPTRTIPGPTEGGPSEPYQAQLRQPGFQIWVNGTPRDGIKLPLPDGRFDVTLFNANKEPIFRGMATTQLGDPVAAITWEIATSGSGLLSERKIEWAKGAWQSIPSVAIKEASGWQSLSPSDTGSLGLLPDGMQIRVPDHNLGKEYTADAAVIQVELGVIELKLQTPERIKILSVKNPQNTYVEMCTSETCRIPVPPGQYLVYIPAAQLVKEPVIVKNGQTSFVYAQKL